MTLLASGLHSSQDASDIVWFTGYGFIEPLQYLTAWVALTDAGTSNGCPRAVPRVWKRGVLVHHWNDEHEGLEVTDLRTDDAVDIPLRAGDIALFWSLTPHSTGPSTCSSSSLAPFSLALKKGAAAQI